MDIQIAAKRMRRDARLPAAQSSGAAGADLYACADIPLEVPPSQTVCIPTGIAVEIPVGYAGFVLARSGLAVHDGLAPANKVGLIDSDYRGELLVFLHNHSSESRMVHPGDRIAQLVIVPVAAAHFVESGELSETDRGEKGFGSTGRA